MKKLIFLFLLFPFFCSAQHVFTTDLNNFWLMRDSVLAAADSTSQMGLVNRLYIAKASDGLKAFMRNKDDLDRKWLGLVKAYPSFWDSLKLKTPLIDQAAARLEKQVSRFQKLYPELQPAQTFFLIGLRQQGGTIRGNVSIIGVEVVLSDPSVNEDQLVYMGIHEYTHTQQKRPDVQKINVLTSSIREGACDFVAHLVTGLAIKTPYMAYGRGHEKEVWLSFQKEMYTNHNDNWVSTGSNPALPAPDLGYFVGYQVCQAYYDQQPDKKAALKQLIELDYADPDAVESFLKRSGYNGGK